MRAATVASRTVLVMTKSFTRRSRGYTLPETMLTLGLIMLAATAAIAGARTWQADQRAGFADTTVAAVAVAADGYHRQFGTFAGVIAALPLDVSNVTFVSVSRRVNEVVVRTGTFQDARLGPTPAFVAGATDIDVCRFVVTLAPTARADRRTGTVPGRCDAATLGLLVGVL
jgi:type II secretory pathway pseudopilin PulG